MTPLTKKLTSFGLDTKTVEEHELLKLIFLEIVDLMDKEIEPNPLPEQLENILMVIQSRLMDLGQKQVQHTLQHD